MKNEYIIISKTAIQQRIEELEKMKIKTSNEDEKGFNQKVWNDLIHDSELMSEYKTLKKILSQSTPLIPEIEKAFENGVDSLQDNLIQKLGLRCQINEVSFTTINSTRGNLEEYISNLKLDI